MRANLANEALLDELEMKTYVRISNFWKSQDGQLAMRVWRGRAEIAKPSAFNSPAVVSTSEMANVSKNRAGPCAASGRRRPRDRASLNNLRQLAA